MQGGLLSYFRVAVGDQFFSLSFFLISDQNFVADVKLGRRSIGQHTMAEAVIDCIHFRWDVLHKRRLACCPVALSFLS